MKPQSEAVTDKIMEILRERGDDFNMIDMENIDVLSMDIHPDDLLDVWPMVMESVYLTVNAPHYQGNVVISEN